jgi:hypothetical protein
MGGDGIIGVYGVADGVYDGITSQFIRPLVEKPTVIDRK